MVKNTQYGYMCCIPAGDYKAEFAFGIAKAKAVVKYLPFIEKFIRDQEQATMDEYVEPVADENIEAMVEKRKADIFARGDNDAEYLKQVLKACESPEEMAKFQSGE